ncbi:MAG: AAA family ATPase, partial [Sphingobacteriales bacterium]
MLSRLYIRNYAIIREIDVRFEKGLNIITGETGAGKSILVGALGLILGERADSSVLLDTSQKCLVEGFFQYPDHSSLEAFFKEQDIERDSEIILRREISSAGKSRAFINDTPVNLTQLQQLAALLVDLHQQFDTLELGQNSFQLDILDALASQLPMRKELAQTYLQYRSALQVWKELEAFKEKEQKEFDYFNFLFTELEEAALKPGEIEALEQELGMLEHAGQVTTVLQKVNHLLDSADQPVTQTIRSLV